MTRFKPCIVSVWAVVVAQLVERLLPTSEVHGSNPVISKHLITDNCFEKTRIKKKRPRMVYLKSILTDR